MIWRNILSVRVNYSFYHTASKCSVHSVEEREILSHWEKISCNQLLSNFFGKNVTSFTKFLPEKCEWENPQFPHCCGGVVISQIYSHAFFPKILWKQRSYYTRKKLLKRRFDEKKFGESKFFILPHYGAALYRATVW